MIRLRSTEEAVYTPSSCDRGAVREGCASPGDAVLSQGRDVLIPVAYSRIPNTLPERMTTLANSAPLRYRRPS